MREFVEVAAAHVDTHIAWQGEGLEEKAIDEQMG